MNEPNTITLDLSKEESALIQMLAGEHGVDTPEAALRVLLQDAVRFYDTLWDKTLAESDDLLDQLAAEAHDEYIAGQTEEFDPDSDLDIE